jgi:hypothetical protein
MLSRRLSVPGLCRPMSPRQTPIVAVALAGEQHNSGRHNASRCGKRQEFDDCPGEHVAILTARHGQGSSIRSEVCNPTFAAAQAAVIRSGISAQRDLLRSGSSGCLGRAYSDQGEFTQIEAGLPRRAKRSYLPAGRQRESPGAPRRLR